MNIDNNHLNYSANIDDEDCYYVVSEDLYIFEKFDSHYQLGKVIGKKTHIIRADQTHTKEKESVFYDNFDSNDIKYSTDSITWLL